MSNLKYDIVLLDADETIFDFKLAERTALTMTAKEFGIEPTYDDVTVYSSINERLWKELELNTVTRDQLKSLRFMRWFEYLGVEADPTLFNERYANNLATAGFLFDDAEEFVKKLSALCDIYIVTNGLSKSQNGRMSRCSIKDHIKKMYVSEEIGFAKPDKQYFDFIFSDLDIKDKSKVIILGDSLSSDMQGGRNAGITTCRYVRSGEFMHSDLCDHEITEYSEFFDILEGRL